MVQWQLSNSPGRQHQSNEPTFGNYCHISETNHDQSNQGVQHLKELMNVKSCEQSEGRNSSIRTSTDTGNQSITVNGIFAGEEKDVKRLSYTGVSEAETD